MCLIFQKNVLDSQGHVCVEEEGIGLKVVLKTAEVDIRTSTRAYLVVAHQQLAVVESRLIQVHFNSCLYGFHHV